MAKDANNKQKATDSRRLFLASLRDNLGVVSKALKACGISRQQYKAWLESDNEFSEAVEEINEEQKDFVEARLLELIREGDTTATIFYSKTKLKDRGYSEKPALAKAPALLPATVTESAPAAVDATLEKKVRSKKTYIVKLLKEQGKYSVELSAQATLVAQLMVKTETLAAEVLSASHSPIQVELSREGNERQSVSAKERLYLDYVSRTQKALKALGMNMDSKAGLSVESDHFADIYEALTRND